MQGKFIVFEGLDGTGKTTQLQCVAQALREKGYTVHTTAEPTGNATGKLLRAFLGGKERSTPWAAASLFLADRINHNTDPDDGIMKHLSDGDIVLCDRYYYSTFAYQGTDTDLNWIFDSHFNCPEVQKPDACVFLTMPIEKCLARIHAGRDASAVEIFENTDSLTRIAKRFADVFTLLKDRETVFEIDADGSIEEITQRILSAIRPILEA
ncbi:MAG: dTMP kinase [Clostridia bacterium]|nr:dTMP kinase [Clostridia bacterium]